MASGLLALLVAGSAAAATPQQIYRDLADNGRLDRKYSRADIDRALSNPSLPAYARPERPTRAPQSTGGTTKRVPALTADDGRTLPFTGLDIALLGAVGGPLLLLGAGVRRVARARATES